VKLNTKSIAQSTFTIFMIGFSSGAWAIAETVHPRDYIAAPSGVNLSVTYLDHRSADDYFVDGSKLSSNADLQATALIQRFIHYTELLGMPADPQIIVPVVDLDVGMAGQGSKGIGDTTIGSTFWPVADAENRQWFGITPFLILPTGDYDDQKAVNVGANRWSYVLQAGYAKGITEKLHIDLIGEVEAFGDNDQFLGNNKLEKDEVYRFNTTFSYDITPGNYVWTRYVKQIGGEEQVNGVARLGTDQDTDTLSVGYTHWIGQELQLQAEYTQDIEVENGFKTSGFTLRMAIPF